jgi:hypothetical protein
METVLASNEEDVGHWRVNGATGQTQLRNSLILARESIAIRLLPLYLRDTPSLESPNPRCALLSSAGVQDYIDCSAKITKTLYAANFGQSCLYLPTSVA